MSNNITLSGTDLRSARQAVLKISTLRKQIESIDEEIFDSTVELRIQRNTVAAELSKAEAHLLEVAGIGEEGGTYNIQDPDVKVSISSTFSVKPATIAPATEALRAAIGDHLTDMVMAPKREFSKSGYNGVLKLKSEISSWFGQWVETKLGNPKIEIK